MDAKNYVNEYWALKPTEEMASGMTEKVNDYYDYIYKYGILSRWRLAYHQYYQAHYSGARPLSHGRVGELTHVSINHYRNLLQHIIVLTTSQRMSFDAQATNSDYRSAAQTIVANNILEYYQKTRGIDRVIKQAVEHALVMDMGYVTQTFDRDLGKSTARYVDPETNDEKISKEGDVVYSNHTPLTVAIDITKSQASHLDWYLVREDINKYTLAAKYPELAEEICKQGYGQKEKDVMFFYRWDWVKTDNVPVWTLYHKKTAALPDGRMTVKCGDLILYDSVLPYRDVPVYRIAGSEVINTPLGYSIGNDLLSVQITLDDLYSSVVTNQTTFGTQNVLIPKGHGISVSQLEGRLNVIEYDPAIGKPEPFNLTATPPEVFNFISKLEQILETISAVNSTQRGDPQQNLKSGTALALVQSMALQFFSGLQASLVNLAEDMGTGLINILKQYANTPRMMQISGKANRSFVKEFTGADIDTIERVVVSMGSAVSKTLSGRIQMAESFMQNGLVKNPEEYEQVVDTGRLEPVIDGARSEMMNIRDENEKLSQGIQCPVLDTDNHMLHFSENKIVLNNVDVRRDPDQTVVNITNDHLLMHMNKLMELSQTNPSILLMSGQQPLPVGPPPGPPPPMGGSTNMNPFPGPEVSEPQQAKLPKNPMTGETTVIPGVNT